MLKPFQFHHNQGKNPEVWASAGRKWVHLPSEYQKVCFENVLGDFFGRCSSK
jgi:hypothetical protein